MEKSSLDSKELDKIQTLHEEAVRAHGKSFSTIFEEALVKYYLIFNDPPKGSRRQRKRIIERWLDKSKVTYARTENSFNFIIKSRRYKTCLEVEYRGPKKVIYKVVSPGDIEDNLT